MAYEPERSNPVIVQNRDALEAIAGMVKATGSITFSANATDTKIVTLLAVVFEFLDDVADVSGSNTPVQIGEDAEETRDNLLDAIQALDTGIMAGRAASNVCPIVAAASSTDAITLEYYDVGTKGNITITKDDDNVTVVGLTGGADGGTVPVSVTGIVFGGDIELGAVELKDAATDSRASIEAANTARTTATKVVAVQSIDAAGAVLKTSAIETSVGKIPSQGQALAAASTPVVLPAAQETALKAVTEASAATIKTNTDPLVASGGGGYVRQDSTGTIAKETGGNLASVKTNTDNIPAKGTAAMAASTPVTIASNDTLITALKTALELIDHLTAANSGDKDANTQRVVLATDDIPTALTNTSIGATDAALVDAGAAGSLSAKLRRISTDLGTIDSDTNTIQSDTTAMKADLNELTAAPVAKVPVGMVIALAGSPAPIALTAADATAIYLQASRADGPNVGNVFIGIVADLVSGTKNYITLTPGATWEYKCRPGTKVAMATFGIDGETATDGVIGYYEPV